MIRSGQKWDDIVFQIFIPSPKLKINRALVYVHVQVLVILYTCSNLEIFCSFCKVLGQVTNDSIKYSYEWRRR